MDKNGGLQERSPTWRLSKTDREEGRKARDEFSRVSYIVQITHGPKIRKARDERLARVLYCSNYSWA